MILLLLLLSGFAISHPPMVILSGFFANGLDAKLEHSVEPHFWCYHNSDYFWLWMNWNDLIPWLTTECLLYNMQLFFDNSTNTYRNNKGVHIRPTDFGGTEGIEKLSKHLGILSHVYLEWVDHFVNNFGYRRGIDIRGAPYDWRLGPKGLTTNGWYDELKKLIEDTYQKNEEQKISLVVLSEGCILTTYFLTHIVTQEWKDQYILNFISLSGTYDGTRQVFPVAIKGKGLGIPFELNPWGMDWGGMPFGLPNKLELDVPIIHTPTRNYTYQFDDMKELYEILGWESGWEVYKYEMEDGNLDRTVPPNVATYCMRGSKVKTPSAVKFKTLKDHEDYEVIEYDEDGDGICTSKSLLVCAGWKDDPRQSDMYPIEEFSFPGTTHRGITRDKNVFSAVEKILGLV